MHDIRKIDLQEGILDENDHIAQHVREHMTDHGILVVNEMGAPGVGKTTTLKNIFKHMTLKPYVIEGDIESDLDTVDLQNLGVEAHQINTYGACHLDAPMIEHATHHIPFDEPGIMFIENIGNLVCPAEFTIGEHVLMLVSTVTEGSDKPYKYPLAFEKADIIILNKVDLIPYLDFDEEFFMKGVRALNKDVPVFKVSGKTGEGFPEVAAWLEEKAKKLEVHEHHHEQHDHHHHD
ncbi:MAG: hydrogenase nickel incorporation protein HypB [Clostridiales bacterium]|nr:hydrogenase nickel incorporation protein HypB [Clostridiales bacterium]MDD6764788.1 hydrogenase nickel incorporation protein HypB [Bacillota bacterium]MDY5606794.1 hydrogenase nickel incorporation protein HypB [Lentihominibacter sp.]MCI7392239.1 hydrogenase nickel incorporation protein HypB [Clostridiales bacterium]MDD6979549.1 hydrogenase nickel incorporation protein HypB [Bacillota bacterium]